MSDVVWGFFVWLFYVSVFVIAVTVGNVWIVTSASRTVCRAGITSGNIFLHWRTCAPLTNTKTYPSFSKCHGKYHTTARFFAFFAFCIWYSHAHSHLEVKPRSYTGVCATGVAGVPLSSRCLLLRAIFCFDVFNYKRNNKWGEFCCMVVPCIRRIHSSQVASI